MARRPSPARIKTHRVYEVWEAAGALGVHRQTVIRWIRQHGLLADISRKPWLIQGRDLKAFLGQRRNRGKCKLELHHCYCVGCKGPRAPDGKIADYTQQTATSGLLSALCPTCGNIMNRAVRRADLDAIRAKIQVTIQKANTRLVSPAEPPLNVTLEEDRKTHVKKHS
ncbi:helix-turn-helix domain-containing protein [Ruegeria sp. YS9]|uniref:helix-turn-helix domain-containing protein n=1 Tax=Ruegeria sp. YS9 TaxID=2966453 RepID=UPI00214BC8A8|nr:helix-turn-helix domain-containing protein [Ruegeria sp. YS9]UUV05881.1 helix-turn-helix domain-containing protein [Ruegeria sp. YS9]